MDNYLGLYYEEFEDRKSALTKGYEGEGFVKKIVARDLEKIGKAMFPIMEEINKTFDVETGVKSYNNYEQLTISYRGRRIIDYIYIHNPGEEENYKHVIEVDSDGTLPNLFVSYINDNNYVYIEDKYHKGNTDVIGEPYVTIAKGYDNNNLDKVIRKHVKYIAHVVAEDRFEVQG